MASCDTTLAAWSEKGERFDFNGSDRLKVLEAEPDSTQSVPEGGQVEALLGLTGFSICGHKQSQYNCATVRFKVNTFGISRWKEAFQWRPLIYNSLTN